MMLRAGKVNLSASVLRKIARKEMLGAPKVQISGIRVQVTEAEGQMKFPHVQGNACGQPSGF